MTEQGAYDYIKTATHVQFLQDWASKFEGLSKIASSRLIGEALASSTPKWMFMDSPEVFSKDFSYLMRESIITQQRSLSSTNPSPMPTPVLTQPIPTQPTHVVDLTQSKNNTPMQAPLANSTKAQSPRPVDQATQNLINLTSSDAAQRPPVRRPVAPLPDSAAQALLNLIPDSQPVKANPQPLSESGPESIPTPPALTTSAEAVQNTTVPARMTEDGYAMMPAAIFDQIWWGETPSMNHDPLLHFFEPFQGKISWDSESFTKIYSQCEREADPTTAWRDPRLCALRVIVGEHTRRICAHGAYYLPNGPNSHMQVKLPPPGESSVFVSRQIIANLGRPAQTQVQVIEADSFDAAGSFLRQNPKAKVLVLNLANCDHPGGGWIKGKMAQEEDLFRRSNLSQTLGTPNLYPIKEFGVLLSKNVSVFRSNVANGYRFLESPFQCDVVSASAYDQNQVKDLTTKLPSGDFIFTIQYISRVFRKIATIFQMIAQENTYDYVVLGALGCGAFRNPPADVAQIFSEVIQQYAGLLPPICFAILGEKNLGVFSNILQPSYSQIRDLRNPIFSTSWDRKSICDYGGKCQRRDTESSEQIYHPSLCPHATNCPFYGNLIHMVCMVHPIPCEQGSGCLRWGDERHCKAYTHPDKCTHKGCKNKSHWHPPKEKKKDKDKRR